MRVFSFLGETVSHMQTLVMMEGVGLGEEEEEAVAGVVVHGGVETQLQNCSDSFDGLL